MEVIVEQSKFGIHKGMQGIYTCGCGARDKKQQKNETSPLMLTISISKQSTWICFIVCVVVTSDMMSLTLEFQRDSINDG